MRGALGPGDFYVDEATQELYIWLAPGMLPPTIGTDTRTAKGAAKGTGSGTTVVAAAADVVAPVTDTLLAIDAAAHIVISNMSFADLTYYADGYWDGPAQEASDAAIRINRATDISIEACNFVGSLGERLNITFHANSYHYPMSSNSSNTTPNTRTTRWLRRSSWECVDRLLRQRLPV